jgi:type IV pilus assembly protein PilN
MPRINLLPWREQQRRERRLAFYAALGTAGAVSALVAFVSYLMFNSTIDAQVARNTRLRMEIKVLDRQIEEINDLESQKQNFISRMQIIEMLQRSRPEAVHLFDELVKVMPDGTYLTSIKQSGAKLKLEGVAQSSTRVSTLMRNIAASQWLRNPELEVVETRKDNLNASRFVLDAEQVSLPDSDTDAAATAKPASAKPPNVKPTPRPAVAKKAP